MASIIQYQTTEGKKFYKFQLYVGTDLLTGKRIKTTRSKFKTKKEAQLALSRLQLEIETQGFNKKTVTTYQEVYDIWEDVYRSTVKESTFVKTVQNFENHILPAMGSYRLDKVTVLNCQKHVNLWARKLKKFRQICAYASKVFDYAISIGILEKNPMKLVTMPISQDEPDPDKVENFYSREELIEFLDRANEGSHRKSYVIFRLLAFSGLRKGEALALGWKDIDFKNRTVTVNKTLTRGENARLLLQAPKTKTSARAILMDPQTMAILKDWQGLQKEELGPLLKAKGQLVFQNEQNDFIQPSKTTRWLERILDRHDFKKITTHGFRHTHCSLLFEAGATIKEVQDRLGHSDVQTTMNIYAHVTEKTKEKNSRKICYIHGLLNAN